MLDTRDIFLVPLPGKALLHAPRHGVTAVVSSGAARELREFLTHQDASRLDGQARQLAHRLEQAFAVEMPLRTGPFAPDHVSLIPTTGCNLRCLYCAPGGDEGPLLTMSPPVAEAALRFYAGIARRDRHPRFHVYYFGGEPFAAWDTVVFCDRLARDLAGRLGIPPSSACTTNACLSEEKAEWVARHLSFVLVSMDGPEAIHDRYRPDRSGRGTHRVVARSLRIFDDLGLPYALRCSVDRHTVGLLPGIVDYFCREFAPRTINLEPLVRHGRCLETGLMPPDPAEFVRAIVEAGKIARRARVALKLTTALPERLALSNCAVADDNFVVAPDGLVSACYGANHRQSAFAADYALGEVDPVSGRVSVDPGRVEKVRSYAVNNIPRCAGCFAKWHCSGGCRLFHTPPFSEQPPNAMCRVTQALTVWRILGLLGLEEDADQVTLESAEATCAVS